MIRQLQKFKNTTGRDLVVWVEWNPDRYVLPDGKWLHIEYDHSGRSGEVGLEIILTEKGDIRLYLAEFDTTVVTIDGRIAEPWEGYEPTSSTPGNA